VPGRVALLVPAFPRVSETFIVGKFLGMLDRGWDVHVVCSRSEEKEWSRFPQLGKEKPIRRRVHLGWPHRPRWRAASLAPVVLLQCLFVAPRRTLRYLWRGWARFGPGVLRRLYLDAELVRLGFDIVHFEFGALAPGRMYLKDLLDCRIVVSFRGYDLNYVGLDQPDHYREVWERADGLHFLGEDLWRRAQRRGCPGGRPHALIPPAIDTDFFQPGPEAPSAREDAIPTLRVLSVGRLESKKGYEYALLAIRMLLEKGVACEYRILGDGEYLGAVAFARHQLGLEEIVTFLGAGTREEVRMQMQQADVLLHAAVSEGFCNAVMEAQAMQLPVVCTDAGGLPENVADGETGFVVRRRDPAALAETLAVLARDPARRQRMGKAGRRRVLTRFRRENQLDGFDRLYREAMAANTPGAVSEARRALGAGPDEFSSSTPS
jgi:colanic acid/amylovoran biosynthesis glycosyltransferase